MPKMNDHLEIISKNYCTLEYLTKENPHHIQWCITIIFYMALHYLHAYFAEKSNIHPDSHARLQQEVRTDSNLKSIYKKYRHLEDDSRQARYLGKKFEIYNMRSECLVWFRDIQASILKLLNLSKRQEYNLHNLFQNPTSL